MCQALTQGRRRESMLTYFLGIPNYLYWDQLSLACSDEEQRGAQTVVEVNLPYINQDVDNYLHPTHKAQQKSMIF